MTDPWGPDNELGRSYDFVGQLPASQFWNQASFLNSIGSHLNKSNDFTVVDVTGFASEHVAIVQDFLNGLSEAAQSTIVRTGFNPL
jgi:hypothetical protein